VQAPGLPLHIYSGAVAILGDNHEREIVTVAPFVAGLQIISVHTHDRAVSQISEGAGNRCCRVLSISVKIVPAGSVTFR